MNLARLLCFTSAFSIVAGLAAQTESPATELREDGAAPASPEGVLDTVPRGEPLRGLRICVDAGHGGQIWGRTRGYTGGARGVESRLTESDANLRAALFLWDLLTQAGAEVVMTRTCETRLSEDCFDAQNSPGFVESRRRELAIRCRVAETNHCDILVAIHHNAVGDHSVNFTTAFYFDPDQYQRDENESPPVPHPPEAVATARDVAEKIVESLSARLDLPSRPARHGDYLILRETSLPSVIIECSFMTNPEEDRRLQDLNRSRLEAIGIFQGILAHFAPQASDGGRS
jgi:N-acetylmuramoyl-L-alanine amidase